MTYDVQIRSVTGTPLLAVRRRATLSQLSTVVPDACGAVWASIRRSQMASHGRNVAVYLNDDIDLEVGVEVGPDAIADGEVILSATPTGMVATTEHRGPYSRLHEAHAAVRQWCRTYQHRLAGPTWEIYGHWSDDPDALRTDVFYLLTADAMAAG